MKKGGGTVIVKGCRLEKGQTGHQAGRLLLEQLYREHTAEEMPPIAVLPGGKPCFTRGGLHFSITHTATHAFCVLADRPVGIDAEDMDRKVDLRLSDKILSPEERVQYDRAQDKTLALLTFWVLKEAAAKCTGEGLRGYPNKTNFSLTDSRVTRIDGCLVAVIQEK